MTDASGFERRHSFAYVVFAVALCDLAMMTLAISINLLPVFLTTFSREFGGAGGLSSEELARPGVMAFAGLVSGILVAGPLADRWGAKLFAVSGSVLIGVGLILLTQAPSYWMVIMASFVMGVGAGVLDMILSPIVSALQPHRRTISMNLLHSFYCTGAVVTILAGALALRYDVGWRGAASWLAGMPIVVAIAFVFTPLPKLVAEGQDRTRTRTLIRKPVFLVALAAIFLGGATELGMAYWLPAYGEATLGFSAWHASLAFLGFNLAMAMGRLAIALLPHRIDPITLMLWCCAGSVVLFLCASFAPIPIVALVSCVLAGLTGSCLWPSTLAVAADRFPHGGATMFALLAALGNIGGVFMPWVVGIVADASNLHLGLATSALCPLLMIGLLLSMRKDHAEPVRR